MERILIEAWEQIEAQERIDEAKKRSAKAKVTVKSSPKGKILSAKVKKLDEEGETTTSGDAAPFKARIGKKYEDRNAKFKKIKEDVKTDANAVAQRSVNNIKANKGNATDATIVGSVVSEEEDLPEAPLPPGAEEISGDIGSMDDAPEVGVEDPAGEEGENVSVDAETAEQVVNAIMAQYPGAVITLSVQLPADTTFDTDLVAAAQEVVGGDFDGEVAPENDPNLDGVPPVNAEKDAEKALFEKRKLVIKKTRKQIKEMFDNLDSSEVAPEETGDEPDLGADAGADLDGAEVSPEVEVGDTKISLSPEQWGQVLATSDLLNGSVDGDITSGIDDGSIDAGGENEEAPEETEISELVVTPDTQKKIDDLKNKNKPAPALNESFNAELAGYAEALQKLIQE